ncbi:hypothetical protein F9288_08410 [Sphingomonas sp. CL5.1]|nr:hypothetical protein [Sphingomonas sp. CL5.1]QKR99663.1 hypothetical protein F9288_08410 [Sphingomonas sp. CL5.1]
MQLDHRSSNARHRIEHHRRIGLKAQDIRRRIVELPDVDGIQSRRFRRQSIRIEIIADMQDRLRRFPDFAQHMSEQPRTLRPAVFRRAEYLVDHADHFLSADSRDQAMQLRSRQIGVADDDDFQPTRPCVRDQRHRGGERETMPRLERQFPCHAGIGIARQVRVDFLDRDLGKSVLAQPQPARRLLRLDARLDPATGIIELRENVLRQVGRAPYQRIEAIERKDTDSCRGVFQQRRDVSWSNRLPHRAHLSGGGVDIVSAGIRAIGLPKS